MSDALPKGTKRNALEHDQQAAFFAWLRLNERKHEELRLFFAIPNGGARTHGTAVALYLEGVRPGVPDTCLPLARQGHAGLWIEFKAGTNDLTANQRTFIAALEAAGHVVHVCREWTDAARITAHYLELRVAVPAAPVPINKRFRQTRREV